MNIVVTDEMVKAVHEYNMGEMGEGSEMTDSRLIERIIELHETSKPKPKAMPCEIVSSDFSENTVTLKMKCDHFSVKTGVYFLCDSLPSVREPLSEKSIYEISAILRKQSAFAHSVGFGTMVSIARAIEKAHGIGVNHD